jgi:DNA-binding response OmpR family regulator
MQTAAQVVHPEPPAGPTRRGGEAPLAAATACVSLLSDRWLSQPDWAGHGMRVVRLGPVGFERLVQDPPDAIVIDTGAADARQLDACWQLHDLLQVPLVLVAPEMAAADVAALLDRGADEIVTGSVDGSLLAARVAAILRRTLAGRPADTPSRVRLGDVTVDLASRTVHRAGESSVLSRTEFELFRALAAARGRVCTHAELAGRVWGQRQPSATRYLRLYIRYLRQKLEVDPEAPRYLLNIWGRGYQLLIDEPGQEGQRAAPRPART